MPGAQIATFNDLASAEALVNDKTCAVIVEPLQGEGGVYPADPAFLKGLRALCDRTGALLIFDEVQCGLGRTGDLYAHQAYGVAPDLMALAKPLGGGLPMGATLLTQKVADTIEPGDHASTFAANPIIAAAAVVSLKKISDPAFLEHVRWIGSYLEEGLLELKDKYPGVTEVRGRGAIWGVQMNRDVAPVLASCTAQGLLVLNAGPQVVRLLPPLVVQKADLDQALGVLDKAIGSL
jgi:acetylornithine/N-succinyldiaminopimelate aminotransferase